MTVRAILVLDHTDHERPEVSVRLIERGYELAVDTAGSNQLTVRAKAQADLVVLDVGSDPLVRATASYRDGSDVPFVHLAEDGAPRDGAALAIGHVNDVLERLQCVPGLEPTYRYQQLEVDFNRRRVVRDGREISLTAHEFGVLAHLARSPGKVWSMAEIFDSAWGKPYAGQASHIWTYIRRLRRKLEPDPSAPVYVLSCARRGYFVPTSERGGNRS
jgi:DNA-binding response OmpR family regulator